MFSVPGAIPPVPILHSVVFKDSDSLIFIVDFIVFVS